MYHGIVPSFSNQNTTVFKETGKQRFKELEKENTVEKVLSKKIETGGNSMPRKMQVHIPKLEDLGLIEILKWCMVSDCLFRANR